MKRVAVEDLADRGIHQREQRIGRHVCVAVEQNLGDDRILDHAEGDRDSVRALLNHRRHLVGEVSERKDVREVFLHGALVERVADLRLYHSKNTIRRNVDVTGDGNRDDFRRICRRLRVNNKRRPRENRDHDDDEENDAKRVHAHYSINQTDAF